MLKLVGQLLGVKSGNCICEALTRDDSGAEPIEASPATQHQQRSVVGSGGV